MKSDKNHEKIYKLRNFNCVKNGQLWRVSLGEFFVFYFVSCFNPKILIFHFNVNYFLYLKNYFQIFNFIAFDVLDDSIVQQEITNQRQSLTRTVINFNYLISF